MTKPKPFPSIVSIINATDEELKELHAGAKRNKFTTFRIVTDRYSKEYPVQDLQYMRGLAGTIHFQTS